jgi:hypothetical protein
MNNNGEAVLVLSLFVLVLGLALGSVIGTGQGERRLAATICDHPELVDGELYCREADGTLDKVVH